MNLRLSVILLAAGMASASPIYLRSSIGSPWDSFNNETALDAVFGPGNWNALRYETANPGALLSPANSFIFMEGSDNNAGALNNFLTANGAGIANWVNAGGRLFINAAPTQGGNINFGFGVTLNFDLSYSTASMSASAVNGTHPIFQGPFAPVGTSFTGSFFSNGFLTGTSLSGILADDQGRLVLAEKQVGQGLVLFGGLAIPDFQGPQPNAQDLRANTLSYGALYISGDTSSALNATPEPATYLLIGGGTITLALISKRSRRR